jgi:hypothetical protein
VFICVHLWFPSSVPSIPSGICLSSLRSSEPAAAGSGFTIGAFLSYKNACLPDDRSHLLVDLQRLAIQQLAFLKPYRAGELARRLL